MTEAIAAFLEARLDDDTRAVDALRRQPGDTRHELTPLGDDMAMVTPGRAAAEIQSKRRILLLAQRIPALTGSYQLFDNAGDAWAEVLKQLALPYASHPDYRDEWRP